MKIDLHVHIHRTSHCAKDDSDAMAKEAMARGIRGIVLLDHNYQSTKEECLKAEALVPGLKVFRGIELNVANDHVVIVSSHDIDFSPKYKEKIMDVKMVADWVSKTNSMAILAHPFRYNDISFDFSVFKPLAIELASKNIPRANRERISEVARKNSIKLVASSDAHKAKQLGCFCIDTDYDINTEEELVEVVKQGKFTLMEQKLAPVDTYGRNEFMVG